MITEKEKYLILFCPKCNCQHLDVGIWATKEHKTHLCLKCGELWRPFDYPTFGIESKNQNIDPDEDGITHINVYSKSKTQLGRKLSNFSYSPFTHPEDGEFCSVEGYWYWLSTKNNKLRKLYGYEAKRYGREVGGQDWIGTDEFKRKIRLAIKAKLDRNSTLREEFLNNKLPLKHYYVYSGKVVEPKEGKWVIEFLEQLKDEYNFENI